VKHKLLVVNFLVFFSAIATAADWTQLYSKTYTFPFGTSSSSAFAISPTYGSRKVFVDYTGQTPCYIQATRIDVTFNGPGGTVGVLPDAAGEFVLPEGNISHAVIWAHSSKWSKVQCTESLYVQNSVAAATQMKFLGSLTIEPSWEEASFKLESPMKVTHFQIEVPAYCDALAVNTAQTMTEGAWDDAKLVDSQERTFEVNGGMGMRISAIRLKLDPTLAGQCPINIYAK